MSQALGTGNDRDKFDSGEEPPMPGIWISDALRHKSFGAVELPFEVVSDESSCVHS